MLQSADGATSGLTQGQHQPVKEIPQINPGRKIAHEQQSISAAYLQQKWW